MSRGKIQQVLGVGDLTTKITRMEKADTAYRDIKHGERESRKVEEKHEGTERVQRTTGNPNQGRVRGQWEIENFLKRKEKVATEER